MSNTKIQSLIAVAFVISMTGLSVAHGLDINNGSASGDLLLNTNQNDISNVSTILCSGLDASSIADCASAVQEDDLVPPPPAPPAPPADDGSGGGGSSGGDNGGSGGSGDSGTGGDTAGSGGDSGSGQNNPPAGGSSGGSGLGDSSGGGSSSGETFTPAPPTTNTDATSDNTQPTVHPAPATPASTPNSAVSTIIEQAKQEIAPTVHNITPPVKHLPPKKIPQVIISDLAKPTSDLANQIAIGKINNTWEKLLSGFDFKQLSETDLFQGQASPAKPQQNTATLSTIMAIMMIVQSSIIAIFFLLPKLAFIKKNSQE